jgi:hypothetical protein
VSAIPPSERLAYMNYTFLLENLAGAYRELGDIPGLRRVMAAVEDWVRRRYPAGSLDLAAQLARLALDYHNANDGFTVRTAERFARESLAIREQKQPDAWSTFNSKALVGITLLCQSRFAEAEPFLVAGYDGLKARRMSTLPAGKSNLRRAGWQLVLLYDLTNRPEKAAALRAELGREVPPPPRPARP